MTDVVLNLSILDEEVTNLEPDEFMSLVENAIVSGFGSLIVEINSLDRIDK